MRTEHNEFFHLLREYLTVYLRKQKDASGHTLKSYRETLNLFVTFLAERKNSRLYSITFDDVTQDSVRAFLGWLSDSRNCGASTVNQRFSIVRAFLRKR